VALYGVGNHSVAEVLPIASTQYVLLLLDTHQTQPSRASAGDAACLVQVQLEADDKRQALCKYCLSYLPPAL
jgi:hypothetical protein